MPERFHDMDKSRAPRALDYAMVLCAVTIWGGSFAATKYALAQAEPSLILCLRLAMTLPVLAAGCACRRLTRRSCSRCSVFRGYAFTRGYRLLR